jgi:hypothetical protein
MSLFVHKENQTLLWNILHKSPYWNMFETTMMGNTQLWFRNIISMFYDKYWETHSVAKMGVDELKQWNKEVILFMVADMKKCLGISSSVETPISPTVEPANPAIDLQSRMAMYDQPPSFMNTSVSTTTNMPNYAQLQAEYNVTEKKEEHARRAAAQFEAFQSQYNQAFDVRKPEAIDFTTHLNEPKIKNMEELVKQQIELREKSIPETPYNPIAAAPM